LVLWPKAEWNDLGCSRSGMPWLSRPSCTMAGQKGLEVAVSRLPVLQRRQGQQATAQLNNNSRGDS
jgi:hypothetical protein